MNYANWLQRVGAYLIDGVPGFILMGIGASAGIGDSGPNALYYIMALLSLGWAVYNRWYLGGQGASLGKKALGMRLIKERTGQPIGMGGAFVRDICHIVDAIICYIGFLFPLWDSKRQTLADKIVSTVVVSG